MITMNMSNLLTREKKSYVNKKAYLQTSNFLSQVKNSFFLKKRERERNVKKRDIWRQAQKTGVSL